MVVVVLWAGLSGWGNQGGTLGLGMQELPTLEPTRVSLVSEVWLGKEAVDGDVARLIAYGADWRVRSDIRAAGGLSEVQPGMGYATRQVPVEDREATAAPSLADEEVVGENPYLEAALEYYGVQEHREALIIVRFRESSNIVEPCVGGLSGERGPYQFLPSTWAGTPYASLDSCDLEAATWAAAWMISEGRWLEWTTWPR